jgi:hypothetical protein
MRNYLGSRRPVLGVVERDDAGVIFWRASAKTRAAGLTDRRIGSSVDSLSDPNVVAAASKLNREASSRLRSDRERRRISRAAIEFRFGPAGL